MILAFSVCSVLMIGKIIIQVKISLDSLVGIAKLLAGRYGDQNLGGSDIFRICPDWPWTHSALSTICPVGKTDGGCVDHPSTSSAEVEDSV